MLDVGLLIIRIVVGALIAGHGLQKLAGWFGGPGIDGNAQFLRSLGYRGSRTMSWLHATAETGAGVLLALGLFTPLAAGVVVGVMLNAALVVHARNGLWVQQGGYEYPLVLATTAAGLALTGPGRFAMDAVAAWELTGWWSLAGIALGLVAGLTAMVMRRAPDPDKASSANTTTPRTPLAA